MYDYHKAVFTFEVSFSTPTYLNEINFHEINFCMDLFLRMPKSKFFVWIYFCG